MARAATILFGIAGAVALATAAAVTAGRLALDRRIEQEIADLFARSSDARPSVVADAELAALPEPVQRWLRRAGVVGRERPVTVRLKQVGEFRQRPDAAWMPFTAEQYYTTDPPGFVWAATMRAAPLLTLAGRDRYVDGRGALDFRLLSLVPVAHASGPELDQGVLLRYLNETMWFPAAALSPAIVWEGIDATSARATISHGGVSATATFVFDQAGDLVDMTAERYALEGDRFVLQPWSTPISDYGRFDGIRVPVAAEGVWRRPTGDFAYIRLRVTALEYNRRERW
jgi:hypothetical protein